MRRAIPFRVPDRHDGPGGDRVKRRAGSRVRRWGEPRHVAGRDVVQLQQLSICADMGAGGFWGWVEFDRSADGTQTWGDARATFCFHTVGGGGAGAGHTSSRSRVGRSRRGRPGRRPSSPAARRPTPTAASRRRSTSPTRTLGFQRFPGTTTPTTCSASRTRGRCPDPGRVPTRQVAQPRFADRRGGSASAPPIRPTRASAVLCVGVPVQLRTGLRGGGDRVGHDRADGEIHPPRGVLVFAGTAVVGPHCGVADLPGQPGVAGVRDSARSSPGSSAAARVNAECLAAGGP